MDDATLMSFALLPAQVRAEAIDDIADFLVRRGLTEAHVDLLEHQVHRVNAALAQWSRPN